MKKIYIFSLLIVVMALIACTDENNFGPGRQEGFLYFFPTEGHSWGDGDKATRADVDAPILMENSLIGQPIYLHTEITPTMSQTLDESLNAAADSAANMETRGIRYTGDVFTPSTTSTLTTPKITSFGVYATKTADRTNPIFDYTEITPTFSVESSSGTTYDPYHWNVKTEEIETQWDSGDADFYGYAPYFDNPSTDHGLSMTATNGEPTLTYIVPTDVANQLDILTAKKTVSKGSDVELEFTHIMSAIKFKFKHGKGTNDGGSTWDEKDNFKWNDGVNTYNVTVKTIQIQDVYTTGTWKVGADPYNGARWTRTANTLGTFTYSNVDKTLTGAAAPVDLNPDYEDYVFMMLPQQVHDDAKIVVICNLTKEGDTDPSKSMTLQAALKQDDGHGGLENKVWLPGYTYTYTLSLSDVVYVFDYYTETSKSYGSALSPIGFNGANYNNVVIRSYKKDSKGNRTPVSWTIQHKESKIDVPGEGSPGTTYTDRWVDGPNGWIQVWDKNGETGTNQVTLKHTGATEVSTDPSYADRLFEIRIGSIYLPAIDLSLYDQRQENRWNRSTANCYIVSKPGTYRIPLIYGNAWIDGNVNSKAYSTSNSGDAVLSTFLNCNDAAISSSNIISDLGGSASDYSACLVWEEGNGTGYTNSGGSGSNEGTIIHVDSEIKTDAAVDYSGGYLEFSLLAEDSADPSNTSKWFNYGNAVVGLKKGDNIVWSWHIWMVEPGWFLDNNPTFNLEGNTPHYASSPVGWVKGGQAVTAINRADQIRLLQDDSEKELTIDATQARRHANTTYFTNVLYQWGRKDPMRGNVRETDNGSDNGAPRGAAGVQAWHNEYSNHTALWTGRKQSIGYLIKNPNQIWGKSRGDLYETDYYNLWAADCAKRYTTNGGTWIFFGKTIYDPSPVGYCVPPSKYFTHLTRSSFSEIDDGTPETLTLPIECTYDNGSGLKFYAAGTRTTDTGTRNHSRGFGWNSEPINAFYHTATPYSKDESWQLRLYFYDDGIDTHNFIRGDLETANLVLPILYSKDAPANPDDPDIDWTKQPLTITAFEAGRIRWGRNVLGAPDATIYYSKNGGSWTSLAFSTAQYYIDIEVSEGDVVRFKGTNSTFADVFGLTDRYHYFNCDFEFDVSGNIMSIYEGGAYTDGNYTSGTTLASAGDYTFAHLFEDNTKLGSAENLYMPAMTLKAHCYESMFEGCTNMTDSPNLPANIGATDCYDRMYYGCTSLGNVRVMLSDANSGNYTTNWLPNPSQSDIDSGEANVGTFYYKSGTSWPANSANGVPRGWTQVAL